MAFLTSFFNHVSDLHFYLDDVFLSSLKPYLTQLPDVFFHRLSNLLSKYDVVGVVNPKIILKNILPLLKKSCSTDFVIFGGFVPGFSSVSSLDGVDIIVSEPFSFSEKGFCFPSSDVSFLKNRFFLACASLFQYSSFVPSSCDVVDSGKLVCESGVFNLDNIVLEVGSVFSGL